MLFAMGFKSMRKRPSNDFRALGQIIALRFSARMIIEKEVVNQKQLIN